MPKGFLEQSGKRTTFRQITRKHLNCEVWVDISKMKKEKGTLKKKKEITRIQWGIKIEKLTMCS